MDTPWLSWLLALGIVAVAVLILVIAAVLIPRTAHAARRRFYCSLRNRNVTVRFLTGERGEAVHVLSCTAFADPLIVTCEQQCVGDTTRPGAPTGPPEVTAA